MQTTLNPQHQTVRIELLDEVARQMKREAADEPERIISHVLANGLHLAVRYQFGDWHLTFWRVLACPTAAEVKACRAAFRIPSDALTSPMTRFRDKRCFHFAWVGPRYDPPLQPELPEDG